MTKQENWRKQRKEKYNITTPAMLLFKNKPILNERTPQYKSEDPTTDKALFLQYKEDRRVQSRLLKKLFK